MLGDRAEYDDSRLCNRRGITKPNQSGSQEEWTGPSLGFGRHDAFKPERWIVGGEFDATAGPQLAFGLGTRGCYGKRLVYVEMRVLLTLIVWNFELLLCSTALSSYKSILITTHEPQQCYVRLREIRLKEAGIEEE